MLWTLALIYCAFGIVWPRIGFAGLAVTLVLHFHFGVRW
jgi:hypothetical protein